MINKETILITGGRGLLGKALLETAAPEHKIVATSSRDLRDDVSSKHRLIQLDVANEENVISVFKEWRPTLVVHTASLGNVDYCEKNREEAYGVNVEGTKNIIQGSQEVGSKIIFISSNAVFNGLKAPYSEVSDVSPVNYYGETKVMGEELVIKSNLPFVIVRLVLMYGWNNPEQRQNPVTWLLDKLRKNEKINLIDDTYVNPLFNVQAAEGIWSIVKIDKNGCYHLAGKERVNRFNFGVKTAKVFGFDPNLIEAVGSDYFPGLAKRMPDTTFDISKAEKEIGFIPLTIEQGLLRMKNQTNY